MELNHTYVVILADTLKKKLRLLQDLIDLTNFQSKLLNEKKVDTDEFEGTLISKQEMIEKLNQADDGFELIYDRVKEELSNHASSYKTEITTLKELITQIIEKSVALQTAERRNYSLMELYFSGRKKEIKELNISQKTVSRYYKNMAGSYQNASYFVDKKN